MKSPVTAVWELTMGCNMRCQHCGSVCENALSDELTTDEALKLCDDLAMLGLKVITLSGGEPTTRKDWNIIAKRLSNNGIITSMITNGWLINDDFIEKAKEARLNTICISIDGIGSTHDNIRKRGAYNKCINALEKIKANNLNPAVITTVNKININELEELYRVFEQIGISKWQLQMALPMGSFTNKVEWMLSPENMLEVIEFAYGKIGQKVSILLADCIGYYSKKDISVNSHFLQDNWSWNGCGAGKHVLGILHNGDIVGCTSIRNRELIAGNIRNSSISKIWNNPNSFAWNREFTKDKLDGFCVKCRYAEICLGGCSNSRYCINGKFESENKYCAYSVQMKKLETYMASNNNLKELTEIINEAQKIGNEDILRIATNIRNKVIDKGQ